MKLLAEEYLKQEQITDYKDLEVTSVDTVTEYGYARLTSELLDNMENMYAQMYWDETEDTARREVIGLYLKEIQRTKADMDELVDDGELDTKEVLLFMVTGNYVKEGKSEQFMFLVNSDKETLHNLDPFSDNLLYKDVK